MSNALVINSSPSEVRVALLENGSPVEVHIEREAEKGVVGNIYRGRVVRVLPGMQAAFVDIGLERTAFLYVNDAIMRGPMDGPPNADTDDCAAEAPNLPAGGRPPCNDPPDSDDPTPPPQSDGQRAPRSHHPLANIADVLSEGQDILVQVQKEALGTKGARITRHISLPGRFVVYMPHSPHFGVSHRISDPAERDRLKQAAQQVKAEGGFILRTVAEGVATAHLEREARLLVQMWERIHREGQSGKSPRLVFSDLDLVLRAIRDLVSDEVARIVTDSAPDRERIIAFLATLTTDDNASKVEFYGGREPIFDHFGIEVEIQRALDRKVWLKSGGHIIIDQAEALTVIDVNSGRYVGKSSLEETITQINLEAVKEVACQLRLRNIGGIIIVDFIDMASEQSRERVLGALEEALRRDKAKTTIVRMSDIGLVEMTRKRVRDSLGHILTGACPYCRGRGFVKGEITVANEILRDIERSLSRAPAGRLLVNMSSDVADALYNSASDEVQRLEEHFGTTIIPIAREGFHREQFEIIAGSR